MRNLRRAPVPTVPTTAQARALVLAALLVAPALLAACGSDARPATSPDVEVQAALADVAAVEEQGTVFVGTSTGVSAVRTDDGSTRYAVNPAVPSPDWAALVSTSVTGDMFLGEAVTHVRMLDPADGSETWSTEVPGLWEVRQVAPAGRAVVLLPPPAGLPPESPLTVEGRATTTMVVVGPDLAERRYELEGNLEPEAFATDASAIFVVQYSPALAPERYRVRLLDLASGEVGDVADAHGVLQEDMPGIARTQVRSPDGGRLYTYYAVARPDGSSYAFVHVLDLDEKWAHCLDLPLPFGSSSQTGVTLAVSSDGQELFVADVELGRVVAAHTDHLTVEREAMLDGLTASGPAAGVAGPDGRVYIADGLRIRAVEADTLQVSDRWGISTPALGLDVSPDGRALYVGHVGTSASAPMGTIEVLDTASGSRTRVLSLRLVEPLVYVGRQAPTLPYGSKECAC